MTFEEATEQKSLYGNTIVEDGKTFLIHIAPKKFTDLLKWLYDYNEQEYDDNIAKNYSSNSEFQLYATMSNHSRKS